MAPPDDDDTARPDTTRPAGSRAGSAYLVAPDDGPGPGVLVLHSWWGLTPGVKRVVEALADAGFTAMAPDLLDGALPADEIEATEVVAASDANATAALVLSSIVALRAHSAEPEAPIAVIGYSMGGSWAMWVATRQPESVHAVVDYYGHQDIDFAELQARVLCHFAEHDPLVGESRTIELQSHLMLLDKVVEVHRHAGTRHFFAEEGVPALGPGGETGERTEVDRAAAEAAWRRTLEFLRGE